MSYTIDVYRGKMARGVEPARTSPAFIGFFPQMVAGPIVRAVSRFSRSSNRRGKFSNVDVPRAALVLFPRRFFSRKPGVADGVAPTVDKYF